MTEEAVTTGTEDAEERQDVVSACAYLWKGFAQDLELTTFDLFTRTKVTSIALGGRHSLFLTDAGLLYSLGANDMGQLGQGSLEVKKVSTPVQVQGFSDAVTAIACGVNHSGAVTAGGQVMCWGSSHEGQCGTGVLDIVPVPSLVSVEINTGFCEHGVPNPSTKVKIKSISCGRSHTLALSQDGQVWAWGAGCQLGLGELRHAPIPRLVDGLKDRVALAVCCGDSHSIVLVLSKSQTTPSSSPAKSKKLIAADAASVKEDKHYPSRCTVCNNEIYTFTDNSDACVIEALHECKNMKEQDGSSQPDQTIVDDVDSSKTSSNSIETEADAGNLSNVADTCNTSAVKDTESDLKQEIKGDVVEESQVMEEFDQDEAETPLSNEDVSICEASILVVAEENPFDSAATGDKSNQDVDETEVFEAAQAIGAGLVSTDKTERLDEIPEHAAGLDGSGACEADVEQSNDSESPIFKQRLRSPSDVSSKSLNFISKPEAMEYLHKQLEDEDTREGILKSSAAGDKTHRHSLTFDNVLGYPSSMISQVKSMTSKAWTNLGTLSPFSSPTQANGGHMKVDTVDGKQQEITEGASSLESSGYCDSPESGVSKSNTSESLANWIDNISAVESNQGNICEGTESRSLRTIEMRQKKLSASRASVGSSAAEFPRGEPRPPVLTTTEVWAWGVNQVCQLGLGDQLDRDKPAEVKGLRGRHVIQVAAGISHSLALTANSQVFSWGSNSYGQLGQLGDTHAPTRVKTPKGYMAWDIAAGANHSVFLGDSAELTPEVFYSGRQPSEGSHASSRKTTQFVSVSSANKAGWMTGVAAGGDNCACLVQNPLLQGSRELFELLATERQFYNQLIKTTNVLLRPLQKSTFYTSMGVFPYKSSLEQLIQAFSSLTKKVGQGLADLTRCARSEVPVAHSHFVDLHDGFLQAFRGYSTAFSDLLSIGGFDFCAKKGIEFFETLKNIRDLAQDRDKSGAASTFFLRTMSYPFYRVSQYSTLLAKLSGALSNTTEAAFVHEVSLMWDCLMCNIRADHKTAEATREFWEGQTNKALTRFPARRLLLESKTHPLHYQSSNRLSSRLFSDVCFILFNDSLVIIQGTVIISLPLETVWVELPATPDENQNGFTVISPEERLELAAPSAEMKSKWLATLNSAISHRLTNRKSVAGYHGDGEAAAPPKVRHATHKFAKSGPYKDAVYQGAWASGKVEGTGIMNFEDGSVYEGSFKRGLMNGPGTYNIVRPGDREVQIGHWKDGKLNGLATVRYSNGDLYRGYFKNNQRFGHGSYQCRSHNINNCTSVYVGEWNANMKNGYGVQDDKNKGEKYMGMWADDQRHGNGVLVTLDGMYFEGNFVQNKLQGFGVMISDDNTVYEGDFMGTTHLSGKGTLSLATGDKLEGLFSGSLNTGLKVTSGTFYKSTSTPDSDHKRNQQKSLNTSKHFGRLCVAADGKWKDIFSHVTSTLTQGREVKGQNPSELAEKAWEVVAVAVAASRRELNLTANDEKSARKAKAQQILLDGLDKIPPHSLSMLDRETVEDIAAYLAKAFEATQHPLGQLLDVVVEVFRASYVGVGAHPRLVAHAVSEIRSLVRRIYSCVRILFPALPSEGGPVCVHPASRQSAGSTRNTLTQFGSDDEDDLDDPNVLILTAAGLIYPILLPKIYPPLFQLYALYNESSDNMYWERVTKLNRQSDMGLMAYLGVEQRFWLMEDVLSQDPSQKLSTIKDVCYAEAVEMLQQIITAFSPIEKLKVIEQTFNEITKTVTERVSADVMWCMDDLFPIFQFVVVRAKLQRLAAEIHLVEELMEPHMECGEFGIMLVTLKACYFQIQNEKMPHH